MLSKRERSFYRLIAKKVKEKGFVTPEELFSLGKAKRLYKKVEGYKKLLDSLAKKRFIELSKGKITLPKGKFELIRASNLE